MRRKFKRTVAVVMALLMVTTTIFATASTASAAEVTESEVGAGSGVTGDCTWTLDDDGTLIISGDGAMEDYGGSRLAPWGQNIKHVEIRYGVTSIGRRAFWRCSRLTDVLIPYSVTNIGLSAFYACTSLKDVIIPDNVTTVDAQAFEGCTSLTDVFMLDGSGSDTLIRYSAFSSCPNLETMVIPDDVTQFEYRAIYDCPKLTIYGKTGSAAKSFANVNGFRFAPMRDSGLTGDCAWMLDNENTLTIMGSGSTGNYTYRYSSPWICYDNEISKVVIKDGVTRVGDYSFFCCTAITSAELSDSVETIGDNAFHSCIGLTDITIPGVTSIEAYAFSNCRGLTSIEIPGNVSSVGGYAFIGCSELTSAEICDGVTSIGEAAFQYCPKLAYVELPDSVTSIGEAAFLDCSKDLVIRGEIDSEAQRFAGENNISFVALNGGDNSASNKMGDVNFDGVVSVFDVTQVQKYIAMFIDFTEQQRLVSDVNNDGRVDITDATRLQRYVAGFEGSLGKYFKAEFSVSSDNEVYSDQKVSAYVKPVGGKSTYTYNYGYIFNGEKTYVRTDHTETKPFFSYYYRFPVAGTYTPFVEVVDGDGAKTTTTLSKSITVIESIKASPECTVSFVGSDEYDSKVKDIQIFDKDGNLFTRNVDYDILAYYKLEEGTYKKTSSSNLREAGKYKITIRWEREYDNTEDYEVEVKRCNLQNNQTSVKWSPVGGTWNGNSIKKGLTVEVKNSGTGVTNFLALNKDYTVTYNYNTSNKTYTATVKGMGKFDGSFTTPTPISYPTERIILTAQNTEIVVNEKEGLSGVIETPDGKELVPNFARVYYKPDKDHKYLLKKDIDYTVGYFYVYNNGVRTGNYTIQITG
ncbi:MAG: leucine-rich repeat protein, partial [Ruminococcus sp.]|nr:leucine-rich repeat protein [Ruminococcus sp.]